MKNNQPKIIDYEQINIDKIDRILTNEQIDLELVKILDNNISHKNDFGFEQNINDRLDKYCQLVSGFTDEAILNTAILRIDKIFHTDEFSKEIENFQKGLSTKLYSPGDLIIITAIFISKKAEYLLFKRSYAISSPYIFIPEFEYNLTDRVFTHNLPSVFDITYRNVDNKEMDYILSLPVVEGILYINKNIEILVALDYQHRTNISSEKIEFYKKIRKSIRYKHKTQMSQQKNGEIEAGEIISHPPFNPNLWNEDCFELFKYLYDNYYNKSKRQLTNIWFYLKELKNSKYALNATKDQYKVFIQENYGKKISNFDKAAQKWEEKDCPTIDSHRIIFEDNLILIAKHPKNT